MQSSSSASTSTAWCAADPALCTSDESDRSDLPQKEDGDKAEQSNPPNPIPGVSPEKEEEGDEDAQRNPKTHECSAGCKDPFGDRRKFMTSALYFAGKDLRIGGGQNPVPGSLGVVATGKSARDATLPST